MKFLYCCTLLYHLSEGALGSSVHSDLHLQNSGLKMDREVRNWRPTTPCRRLGPTRMLLRPVLGRTGLTPPTFLLSGLLLVAQDTGEVVRLEDALPWPIRGAPTIFIAVAGRGGGEAIARREVGTGGE